MEPDLSKADFSGYATKAGLLCSDGRTILPGAFKHHDQTQVPLVWQHDYGTPTNVLGYAILQHREDGTYAYGFFADTESAQETKKLVQHGAVNQMSIYANKLKQDRSRNVSHGMIREVSLVLAGANPGAVIEQVNLAHGDGIHPIEDEAVIFTDDATTITLSHSEEEPEEPVEVTPESPVETAPVQQETPKEEPVTEAVPDNAESEDNLEHADKNGDTNVADKTVKEVYDAFSEDEKTVVHALIATAVSEALEEAGDDEELKQSAIAEASAEIIKHMGENNVRNTFELANGGTAVRSQDGELRHSAFTVDEVNSVFSAARGNNETLKSAFLSHAETQDYGIENIDFLFPDAQLSSTSPEFLSRRTEWVNEVLGSTKKSRFSRIKSVVADITEPEARARGYVKGTQKKEEVLRLLRRQTSPTTIYKLQKLDRDDILDITGLDIVAWLKVEMRVMLDEEVARAILIGDGREADDESKIDEDKLRPIATDDDMYAHKIELPSNVSRKATITSIVRSRTYYKGSGTPTLFTTESLLTELLLLEDGIGRRLYSTEQELASTLRVSKIVPVEVMENHPTVVGIIVNLIDYTVGADQGGQVSMFDDFDIDFNQQKYLMETRISGALTKPKSAIVIEKVAGTSVVPNEPAFANNTITIPTQAGVDYYIDGEKKTGSVPITGTTTVEALAKDGYTIPAGSNDSWTYQHTA